MPSILNMALHKKVIIVLTESCMFAKRSEYSSERQLLRSEKVAPAVLKSLSLSGLVGGIARRLVHKSCSGFTIRIQFKIAIRNKLLGTLFGPKQIEYKYSVQL